MSERFMFIGGPLDGKQILINSSHPYYEYREPANPHLASILENDKPINPTDISLLCTLFKMIFVIISMAWSMSHFATTCK